MNKFKRPTVKFTLAHMPPLDLILKILKTPLVKHTNTQFPSQNYKN